MEQELKELFSEAKAAMKKAYAPYSRFTVGAAILTAEGNIFKGCNVENASLGLTSCAERNAIFSAVQQEGKEMKLKAVAIACDNQSGVSPCGACRQVIKEFSDKETVVIYYFNGNFQTKKIAELLPDSFAFES